MLSCVAMLCLKAELVSLTTSVYNQFLSPKFYTHMDVTKMKDGLCK